jgi:hypothetical protein
MSQEIEVGAVQDIYQPGAAALLGRVFSHEVSAYSIRRLYTGRGAATET